MQCAVCLPFAKSQSLMAALSITVLSDFIFPVKYDQVQATKVDPRP